LTSANRFAAAAIAAAALLLGLVAAHADVAVPPLQARVTDLTATLDAGQRAALEARLAEFEKRKGSQIAVLLLPSTQPETIEQFSIRVVDQWKLGRKGIDDGALLLVAKNDRAVRIEVGRGLEGPLPDAIASRIIREHVTPRFREGDFYGGINAGVDRMIAVIDGEPLPAPKSAAGKGPGAPAEGIGWSEMLMFALIAGTVGNMMLRSMFGRFGAAALTGGGVGLGIWIFFGGLAFAILGGIAMFVFALIFGSGGAGRWASGGRRGGWGGGGWGGGGGWSSGGGGFSGGGGGFSGGGASGRW